MYVLDKVSWKSHSISVTGHGLLQDFREFLGWRRIPPHSCLWVPAPSLRLPNLWFNGPGANYTDLMWRLTHGNQPSFLISKAPTLHENWGNEGRLVDIRATQTTSNQTWDLTVVRSPLSNLPSEIPSPRTPLAISSHLIVCVFLLAYHFLPLLSCFCITTVPPTLLSGIQDLFHSGMHSKFSSLWSHPNKKFGSTFAPPS